MNNGSQVAPSDTFLRLFQELLWPAVAGNVLWSFFSLWLDAYFPGDASANPNLENALARLWVLALLGIYLCYDWIRMLQGNRNEYAWIADLPHAACITVFSLMVQSGRNQMTLALVALLIITGIGHLTTLWESKTQQPCGCRRLALAAINFAGAGSASAFEDIPGRWNLPIAMLVVLIPWFVLRRRWG